MAGTQPNVHDSMDSENGNFLSFADVVDSTVFRLRWAMAADGLGSDVLRYLTIHLLDIEWDYYRNFQRIDAAMVPMVNNQRKPVHKIHCFEPLNWKKE